MNTSQAPSLLGILPRAEQLFSEQAQRIFRQTDRMFAILMAAQWVFGIVIAAIVSPRTWSGAESRFHPHLVAAVFLGAAISFYPVYLGFAHPGRVLTRHVIAVAQMLTSALLVHLTGGRIETHFHIFGSLAFLAMYRDWKVFVPATAVIALDHIVRGIYFPQSVFGVLTASPWRPVEHACWVLFENFFLVISCVRSVREMKQIGMRQAELEQSRDELRRHQEELEDRVKRRTAQLAEAKERADLANRAKSEFLANVSHEIRTPMNAVLGMTELALETGVTAQQREYLETAHLSAEELLTIINDILDFSKMESKKLELRPETFNVRKCAEETVRLLAFRAHQKGLDLTLHVERDVPTMVIGDRGRIRQILLNLAGNAIKFTEAGQVALMVRRDDSVTGSNTICFSVRDTGIGIPKEVQGSIFEAFTQVDGSLARRVGGTGLGLTISSQLVTLMGGRIWVDSEPGQGSTFYFSVPLEAAAVTPELETRPLVDEVTPAPARKERKALVVDDNRVNRKIAMSFLSKYGFEAVPAENGLEALARVAENKFDVVLMDVQMPEMDGIEATAEIRKREQESGRHTPIIAVTAHAMNGDRERCLMAGMDGYLSKPIRAPELRALLQALADTGSILTSK